MTNPRLLALLAISACASNPKQPDQLVLPGDSYYPESLSAGANGTIYVGSLTSGEIAAFDDGKPDARTVHTAGADGVTGVTGVLAHGSGLWACSIDLSFQRPTEVVSFDLTGNELAHYPLAANQFCNDLAFDGGGNLYVADSFSGAILELPAGGDELVTFAQDARLAAVAQGAFGGDGIVYDGHGALYVNAHDTGALLRVDLATGAFTPIAVTPALDGPDGMRLLDDHTLLVVEWGGAKNDLAKLTLSGDAATATALATDLAQPTSVAIARGFAWVSEGQLGGLFANPPQAPNLPFDVQRVQL